MNEHIRSANLLQVLFGKLLDVNICFVCHLTSGFFKFHSDVQ